MKNFIKKILPDFIVDYLKKKYKLYNLRKLYNFDKNRFINNSYQLSEKWTVDNLRAKITFHYHAIEKGLSHEDLRYNFGEKALNELFFAMDKFIESGYDTSDLRFQQGISVLEAYVKAHKDNGKNATNVESKLYEYIKFKSQNKVEGGASLYKNSDVPDFSKLTFSELLKFRHSVRDYGIDTISDEDIYEAIKASIKSPSACNRHPWKVYLIKNPDTLKSALSIQGGFRGHGENIQRLILVTSSKEYFNNPNERNQTYIDGGMFASTLLYSLTEKNIATCPLHGAFTHEKELKIRNLLDVSDGEDLICFITLGSFKEKGKYANSPRDSITSLIKEF